MTDADYPPLQRDFYWRHPAEVAPDLLGRVLVRQLPGLTLCGRIVETEAYSDDDPASHSFRGESERNRAMFGEVGHAYIYFIHGLHYCMNVTAKSDEPSGAVLIRALEPLCGTEEMRQHRRRQELHHLTSGPAKLTQALSIDKALYGIDLTETGPLFIGEDRRKEEAREEVAATARVGISRATDRLWRFVLTGSPHLSR